MAGRGEARAVCTVTRVLPVPGLVLRITNASLPLYAITNASQPVYALVNVSEPAYSSTNRSLFDA